jgi:uncharacterized membrane protein YqhA
MIQYFVLVIAIVIFIMYYLNYNPFIRKLEQEDNTSELEISINELKNLNQYIDNGPTNYPAL